MRKRMTIVAAGALLCAGAIAAAQAPPYTVQADRGNFQQAILDPGSKAGNPVQATFTGNVVFVVNGVTVRADRAVVKDGEVQLEGNVRMTLPATK